MGSLRLWIGILRRAYRNPREVRGHDDAVEPCHCTANRCGVDRRDCHGGDIRLALQLGPVSTVSAIDKSSIVLTVLLAIVLLEETEDLAVRLIGIALIGIGTLLMVEWRPAPGSARIGAWVFYAVGAAVCAALTAILGKVGITGVESNLGTAIRTVVVLAMAWLVVALKHEGSSIKAIPRKELSFIGLSGLATGASWLCYWRAMQDGPVSVVAPIDKLGIVVTVVLARFFFHERQSRKALVGLALIVVGTLVMVIPMP